MVTSASHPLVLTVLLAAAFSSAASSDRWVWSSKRENRQAPQPIFPPFMPPFIRREVGRLLASSSSAEAQVRRPSTTEAPPVREERVVAPLKAGPRGVPQEALVVPPLPLDISKLPLESSPSESLLNLYAPNDVFLASNNPQQTPTLSGESRLVSLPLEHGTPSLQTKSGHVEALVATPDISQLPLQVPVSSSLSPATFIDLNGPTRGDVAAASPSSRDKMVFPLKVGDEDALRTVPPASSTPVPTRVFLRDFSGLDASPFHSGDTLGDERFLKTFSALQKETLTQHSNVFQGIRRFSEGHNDLQDGDGRMVFPKLLNKSPLRLVEPPQFGDSGKGLGSRVTFSLPVLQPQVDTAAITADTQRLERASLAQTPNIHTENSLTVTFKESKGQREGRKVPPHAWLWPDELPVRGGPHRLDQPSLHVL